MTTHEKSVEAFKCNRVPPQSVDEAWNDYATADKTLSHQAKLAPAELAAIARIEARFHPHYGIDGATDSRQLARDCRTLITWVRQIGEQHP